MALSQSALSELLDAFRAGDGVDLIRESVRVVLQELIEAEATEVIGAGRYERTESRITDRNGSRPRLLTTKAGMWPCRSRSCGPGRSSRSCLSRGAGSTGRCSSHLTLPADLDPTSSPAAGAACTPPPGPASPGFVMVYGPRNDEALDTVQSIVAASHAYATGRVA